MARCTCWRSSTSPIRSTAHSSRRQSTSRPRAAPPDDRRAIVDAVVQAARALGLRHGPIHAECRVNHAAGAGPARVFVLEVAARPIGGLCARALRFANRHDPALTADLARGTAAAPRAGGAVDGMGAGGRGVGRDDDPDPAGAGCFAGSPGSTRRGACRVWTTCGSRPKPTSCSCRCRKGQVTWASFSPMRLATEAVTEALREAHARLAFTIDPEVPVLQSRHG